MHTVADQLALFVPPAREALTRDDAPPETGPAETLQCPRCSRPLAGEMFYGPCGACRIELRTRAVVTAPRPPHERTEADTAPVLAAPPATFGGLSTRRFARIIPRVCAFVDLGGQGYTEDGRSFAAPAGNVGQLLAALPADVGQVYLAGARPGGDLGGFRRWFEQAGDWRPAERGHWLHSLMLPVLRFVLDGGGGGRRQVEISRAASWYDEAADAEQLAGAHRSLRRIIEARFEAPVLATPATTGRDLWRRTIPAEGWPRVSAELAELIRSTSGQHRHEVIDHGAGELARVVEVDGRWMYAALCRGLPAGLAVRGHGEPDPVALGYGPADAEHVRGRYRCSWQVPAGWAHVGLLPEREPGDGGGWHYPRRPRARASGWIDGAELQLARRWGWPVTVHEHIAWPANRGTGPLDQWTRQLIRARADAARIEDQTTAQLVAGAVRAILLHGLGAMHGRPHLVTKTAELHEPERIPADAIGLRSLDGVWTWAESDDAGRQADTEHPEWTSAVWARERVRVLDGPGIPNRPRTGALHVPFDDVIGFAGDAIYLKSDPAWPDDGKEGRMRTKRAHEGPFPAPRTRADLLGLLGEVRT